MKLPKQEKEGSKLSRWIKKEELEARPDLICFLDVAVRAAA